MLKLSQNAVGMLTAKYRSVLKKMFLKNSAALMASGLILCAPTAEAANYDVGAGQTYTTLDDLRVAAAGNPNFFQDGDTVNIHTADIGSLTNSLDFQDKDVTVRPSGTNVRLFNLIGQTAEIANDSGVSVRDFNTTSNGGAVLLIGSTLKVGDATFSGNTSSNNNIGGGAIHLDNSHFNANTVMFSNNTANISGYISGNPGGGGAIDIRNNSSFTANDAVFSNNTVVGGNGAAVLIANNSSFTIVNTAVFSGNTSPRLTSGGAVMVRANSNFTAGDITFSENSTGYQGGALFLTDNCSFTANNANFFYNTAYAVGGAGVLTNSSFKADTATFLGNTTYASVAGFGGAVALYSSSFTTDIATFSDNSLIDNSSGSSSSLGGAVYLSGGNFTATDTATFLRNTASSRNNYARGGAILLSGSFTADTAIFLGNTASAGTLDAYGGAICAYGGSSFTANTATFSGNTASKSGGAIYSYISGVSDLDFKVNTATFSNNEATNGNGGAIFAEGNLTLYANGGYTTFQGNIASGKPNAIYMDNNSNNKTLVLSAKDGYAIRLYDPIQSNDLRPNLIIGINETAADTGTVLFDTYQSEIYGRTSVYNGTMALNNGAIYGADSGNQWFTLRKNGTLLSDTASNKIQANNIMLEGDHTLSFNMDRAVKENDPGETTNLIFTGTNFSGQAIGAGNIDIFSTNPLGSGVYTLVKATGISGLTFADSGTLTYDGQPSTANARQLTAVVSLLTDYTTKLQLSVGDLANTTLTWMGYDTSDPTAWNELGAKNWDGMVGINPVTQFLNGDKVRFLGDGPGDVIIESSGVTVDDMEVNNPSGDDYTFKDGGITVTGTLTKDGEGAITFNNANTFNNDINLNKGRINIGNGQALGTAALIMQDGTTLGFTGDHNIANNITIEPTGTAIFDVESQNDKAAISGSITGGGFEKTGLGELTVGNGATNHVENVTISKGTLKIAANKTVRIDGLLDIADGATLSVTAGANSAANPAIEAGSVNFDPGSILNVSGYSGRALGDTVTLIKSVNDISSLTNNYTIGGNVTVDYLTAQVRLSSDQKSVLADVALTWYDPHQNAGGNYDKAHGTFTINGATNEFTMDTVLANRSGNFTTGWNGTELTKDGAGKLILAGDNGYTGGTVIKDGVIVAQSKGSLGTEEVDIKGGAFLTLNFDNAAFVNELIGNGGLNIDGDVDIDRDNSNFDGKTNIFAGKTLALGRETALGFSEINIANTALLSLEFDSDDFGNELTGSGGLNIDGNIRIDRDNSGFGGNTNIAPDKTLTLGRETALGSSEININDDARLSLELNNGTFGNKLIGGGDLSIDGGVRIDRDNSGFSGNTTITANNKLTLGGLDALGTSKITNNATLEFDIDPSQSGVFDNLITNNGELIKSGEGEFTLANTGNNYSGKTVIDKGILGITVADGGSLAFGEIFNNSWLKFSGNNPTGYKDITINNYSGEGVIGLEAEVSAAKQWSDLVTFTTTPDVDGGVKVHFYFLPISDIKYMPDGGLKFASLPNGGDSDTFSLNGTSGIYGAYQLSVKTNDSKDYYLLSNFSPEQGKVYSAAAVADLERAAWMHSKLLYDTVSQAVSQADADNPGIAAGYENSDTRHNIGNHADIRGNNMAIAMGWKANEKTTYGIFGRLFNGSYDTVCDSGSQTISALGDMKSHAVGLFANYRPGGGERGHYYQAMVSAGRTVNDFRADNAMGGSRFKSNKNLQGMSLGGGYVKTVSQDRSDEYYSHLIYTHLGSKDITDSIGQNIRFDSATSFRLMSGMRFNFNQSKKTSSYLGAALDYEFRGKPDVYINGNKTAASDLKGLSGVIELGLVSKKSESLSIDLSLQGWVGKKKGVGGTLMLSKRF